MSGKEWGKELEGVGKEGCNVSRSWHNAPLRSGKGVGTVEKEWEGVKEERSAPRTWRNASSSWLDVPRSPA